MFRFLLIFLSLMCWSSLSAADDVTVGPVNVHLTSPGGACAADESNPSDKRFVDGIRGMLAPTGNTLLGAYVNCRDLTNWHSKKLKYLPHSWQYQAHNKSYSEEGFNDDPHKLVKGGCADLRSQGDKYADEDRPNVQARAKAVLKKIEVNGSAFIGVLDETPDACYAAILQDIKAEAGFRFKQVALWAIVVIKHRVIYYYSFAPYSDGDSVAKVLADFKPNVNAFLEANK